MQPTRHSLALGLWVAACSTTRVPEPVFSQHHERDFVEVDYPPPAGLVEIVPEPPNDDSVWVDGHWIWRGRYWVWGRGGWVIPPRAATLAPWELRYSSDGRLWFAAARWRDARGVPVAAPPFLVPAAEPPEPETAEKAARP